MTSWNICIRRTYFGSRQRWKRCTWNRWHFGNRTSDQSGTCPNCDLWWSRRRRVLDKARVWVADRYQRKLASLEVDWFGTTSHIRHDLIPAPTHWWKLNAMKMKRWFALTTWRWFKYVLDYVNFNYHWQFSFKWIINQFQMRIQGESIKRTTKINAN